MTTTRTYRVAINWTHRKYGPDDRKCIAEGSSIRRAIANALLAFFSEKPERKARLDAHKHIKVEAWRLPTKAVKDKDTSQ